MSSFHGGSLEITLTFPFNLYILYPTAELLKEASNFIFQILKKLEALWITKIQAIDADATVAKSNPRKISQPVPRNIVKAKRNTKKSGKCENPVPEQTLDDEVDLELTGAGLQLVVNPEKSKLTEPNSEETPVNRTQTNKKDCISGKWGGGGTETGNFYVSLLNLKRLRFTLKRCCLNKINTADTG